MALDGISIHALVHEFNETFLNGKINKISQPEKEELLITINTQNGNKRLLVSANASLPFMYITDENKTAPAQAPGFCMLLRKHIGAGRIIEISQMGMERAVRFKIQHLNEMGDITYKYLYIEIMGKHSNIIFCNEDNMILDSIKHIPSSVSSVREVLPGRDYFIPTQEGKTNPLDSSEDAFKSVVLKRSESVFKALMSSYIGISPTIANEICFRAGIDSDASCASLFDEHKEKLWASFTGLMDDIRNDNYSYNIIVDGANGKPLEYAPVALTMYQDMEAKSFETMSEVLIEFYAKRNQYTNIRQKSADLRKIINNHIERASKKLDLQLKQQKDTEKRDKYKIYGEMLHTYGYEAKPNDKSITVINYYDNKELTIPLDPDLSATENAKKYFDKYAKLKRTAEALNIYIEQSKQELELLQSIEAALNIAENEGVKSCRFMGDIGYVVTFRNTDPLFAIDLSNPKNPVILSELKLPGFSEYLHAWGENYLLGIGYDADEENGSVECVKLTMFDISDPTDVKEVTTKLLDADSADIIDGDYKSLMIDPDKGIFGFFMRDWGDESDDWNTSSYYKVFRFEGDEFTEIFTSKDLEYNYYAENVRGLYAGDYFYLVENKSITSYNMDKNFEQVDCLE